MAQPLLRDPIVSAGPTLTGTGTGTLTVDKLTHFTVAQTYTQTCISKSPDTVFSVVGSIDGAVGLAKAGTQFFDEDLKVFFTIVQGSTPFEVGDVFTFSVINGTDLNQDNIDDYDELTQKNFGVGTKGTLSGDNNIRYSDTDEAFAALILKTLRFNANTAGAAGNAIQVQYLAPVGAVTATRVIGDLTFTAATAGAAGNAISVQYVDYDPAVKAEATIQAIEYRAQVAGTGGNSITVAYTTGATAGAEVVTVVGNAITVQIQSGVSTATQIQTKVLASAPAFALVSAVITGSPTAAQTAPVAPTSLTGGTAAVGDAGNEVVTVVSNAITVKAQSGFSTANQIRAKLIASVPASALVTVTVSGTGTATQTIPAGPLSLTGGSDAMGSTTPAVSVVGNLIKVYFQSGVATTLAVWTALVASSPAMALVNVDQLGADSDPIYSPTSISNLSGGTDRFFSHNKHELTQSGSFFEGNASTRVFNSEVQGKATAAQSEVTSRLSLTSGSSAPIVNAQDFLNWLSQDGKMSLRTSDNSAVSWSSPNFVFSADLVIDFNDSGQSNTVLMANSPISIADGFSLYVLLQRDDTVNLTPFVASSVPNSVHAFRIATRFGTSLILWDNSLMANGTTAGIGAAGGGGSGGAVRVDLYNPVATTLPTGAAATIDGVALVNDMLVLFSNLSSNNNRIYKASGVGSSITWAPQTVWSAGLDATLAEEVIVAKGTAFGLQHGIFNGTTFKFNDTVRYFNGTDYWEVSSIKALTMTASTTADVFSVTLAGSENLIVDYSIIRGIRKETGTLHITATGTTVALTTSGAFIGASGVVFNAVITTGVLHVTYTADGSSGAPSMKYYVRRWSDSGGGPAGVPSYSGSGGSGAAGSDTQIQFNDAGSLGADSDFTWDKTTNTLGVAGLNVVGLAAQVLADNTASPATIFSYNAGSYPFVIIEFSLARDSTRQIGRMLVVNDGTNVNVSVDFANALVDPGITFSAAVSGGNVLLQYTSTSTTFSAQFKYSMRRWA